ncbi:hypothetical protein OAO01_00630 [Oligoflexia bacterium]|nr:hypothetical protein [Oligoflexia bacterium]
MKHLKPVITVLLIFAAAFYGGKLFFPNEEDVVRSRLSDLAKLASINAEEHPFERLGAARKIGRYFIETVSFQLKAEEYEIEAVRNRDALVDKIVAIRSMVHDLKVKFVDMTVTVDGINATAHFTVTAEGTHPNRQEPFFDAAEVKLDLEKDGGTWLITKVQNVEAVGY